MQSVFQQGHGTEEVACRRTLQHYYARPLDRLMEVRLFQSMKRVRGATLTDLAQVGANLALEACWSGSAGVSLLDQACPDLGFRWTALTGLVFELPAATSPRYYSACGECMDAAQPLLFRRPANRFGWMQQLPVIVHELLVAPIFVDGVGLGTVWTAHHVHTDHFDASDLHYLDTIAELMGGNMWPIRR
jgi:GAF domain-containing protein